MSLGLFAGSATAGYRTSPSDLALMGAVTGLVLGTAQSLALPGTARRRWLWAAAMPALWALGWTTTTLGGIDVDRQFTVFGAYGAVAFSALSGLLLPIIVPPSTHPRIPTGIQTGEGKGRRQPWRRDGRTVERHVPYYGSQRSSAD